MFRLAKLSLANRALIALITVFACVFGVITMSSLKQELIPSIEFPQITVICRPRQAAWRTRRKSWTSRSVPRWKRR